MFKCLKDKWNTDFVFKKDLPKLTGGVLSEYAFYGENKSDRPKSNKIGRKAAYYVDDVISWLNAKNIEIIER